MKIAVDVMGFENDISEAIFACEKFVKENKNVEIILVGNQDQIKKKIKNNFNLEIVHSEDEILQTDNVFSTRIKKQSSMQITANLLKDNKVDGLLSAGNTSVFVYIIYSTIGMLDGVNKIGFMPTIPTIKGVFNMVDVGASIDVNADDLFKFALIANIYSQQKNKNPKIGVLNIGTENHKGLQIHRDVNELLKNSELNYVGFVESKNLLEGDVDVVIADAYSGNLVLKACEGTAKTISNLLKSEYKKPKNFLAALLSLNILKNIKEKFDYKNNAGAFLIGVKKNCVKTHGSADWKQFYSSLRMLKECIDNKVIEKIEKEIKNYDK